MKIGDSVKLANGRVREFRGYGKDSKANYMYYRPVCSICKKKKGKSQAESCMNCRSGYRGGLQLKCPHCDKILDRDTVVVAFYFAGFSLRRLAPIFNLSTTRVSQILKKHA